MNIVINDANILIDIVKLDLLEYFLQLDFDFHTTDFVLSEISDEQLIEIQPRIDSSEITLITTSSEIDFNGITQLLQSVSGLSFEDCSVWYYSKLLNAMLLTGDRKLRKEASSDGVEVHGIIFVLDEIIDQNVLTKREGLEKLEILYSLNSRLPKSELIKRRSLWGS